MNSKLNFFISKKDDKDQESIQSCTKPVPGNQMGKLQKPNKLHKQESRGKPFPFIWPQCSNEQTRKHDKHNT